jgi:hypothetical protein
LPKGQTEPSASTILLGQSRKDTPPGSKSRCPGGACLKLGLQIPSADMSARRVPRFDDARVINT